MSRWGHGLAGLLRQHGPVKQRCMSTASSRRWWCERILPLLLPALQLLHIDDLHKHHLLCVFMFAAGCDGHVLVSPGPQPAAELLQGPSLNLLGCQHHRHCVRDATTRELVV